MRTIKKYETHCHTSPVSKCGRAAVVDTVNFYKKFGYDGKYELMKTAGSDNHWGKDIFSRLREKGFRPVIAGMCCETELECVEDYIASVQNGTMQIFLMNENMELFR